MTEHRKAIFWTAVGALIALSNTVNTMLAGVLNPLLSAITSGKGSYV